MTSQTRILVIKLGALGDFVLSLGSMQAIRQHHPDAEITLLTTKAYAELAKASGLYDAIWLDEKPKIWQARKVLALRKRLNDASFRRIYDLQRNDRSAFYFRLLASPKPEWVGKVKGCSHRYIQPEGKLLHISDREADQLALAGIERPVAPDLSFIETSYDKVILKEPYVLFVPGGAPHRPEKRWPASKFAELGKLLEQRGYDIALLGTKSEKEAIAEIRDAVPAAIDLSGKTSFLDIVALARKAKLAVGNDTGPMHLAAAAGAPCLSLFSSASWPEKTAPRGPGKIVIMQRDSLADLSAAEAMDAAEKLLTAAQ